jgi:hypothetical protein
VGTEERAGLAEKALSIQRSTFSQNGDPEGGLQHDLMGLCEPEMDFN